MGRPPVLDVSPWRSKLRNLYRKLIEVMQHVTKRETDRAPDFHPAGLRLIDDAPSPLPQAVLKVTMFFVVLILVWASLGRLDIVAVAQGKLVPMSYVKIVQPAEQGIVKEILVAEGAQVKAGDVLIRMDAVLTGADHDSVSAQYREHALSLRRVVAELSGGDFVKHPEDVPSEFARVEAQFRANRQELRSSIALEESALERARSELAGAQATEEKLKGLLESFKEEEAALLSLRERGVVGRLAVSEKTRERIQTEQDLRTQGFAIRSARAAIQSSKQQISQLTSSRNRQLQTERSETAARLAVLEQELTKSARRQELLELRAPQDGVIQDLSTHSIGTVVSPGTVLLTLVPTQDRVRAEVWIDNADIGFVRAGQKVKLKMATFQFQKYGMVDGTVIDVSADAHELDTATPIRTESLAYRALVELNTPYIVFREARFNLLPGMRVTGEIKLGTRTIFEYLLSPVVGAFQESARER